MKHFTDDRRYVATDQLKTRIREQGRNFRWVANQLDVSESHFNRVLSGERWVTEANARSVAALLGTDFSVLWKVLPSTIKVPMEAHVA